MQLSNIAKKAFNKQNCAFVASIPKAIDVLKYKDVGPSVAVIGQSNVGKSMLTNKLLRVKYATPVPIEVYGRLLSHTTAHTSGAIDISFVLL